MEPKPLTSAFESPTFDEDSSFHVDQPVGSMSISPCGRDVVLASKEGLHLIDLDSPYSPPRYLPHHTPWEVADVQWSPFGARDYWVVSTSNQKALVWNLAMKTDQNSIEHVLHAHSRAITDINFSAHHPDILATCSVDSFVHSWDLRIPSRPVISFSDWFAGATQVKWNRQDSHVIASSHDKFLRIWDDRMGAYPIRSIEAHSTKIYGVDWNRVRPDALLTCSLDKTIKFWDYTAEGDVPEKLIHTPFPVWRARNTPFGWGVLAMPQRGNSDLHLYSRRAGDGCNPENNLPLVHSFPGHKGQVKEFLWRSRGSVEDGIDNRDFQLVSWGTDKELRLHKVDHEILQDVGYEKGRSIVAALNVTRRGSVYRTFRDEGGAQEFDDAGSDDAFVDPNMYRGGVGMDTIDVPYGRSWTQKSAVPSRVGMQGKANIKAETNPISWMRGVKVSSGWDMETLENEITHVGEKFTKVIFESIDVKQRKATISLHGPWGTNGSSLFLKVDIKFPNSYPRAGAPSFSLQKTAAVTDQLASKIVSEVHKIAETYLTFKRGCMEGVIRYLLGESTLEESTEWLLAGSGERVGSPVNGEIGSDESSDEDEVGMSRSQDLATSTELLAPVNANALVPVARKCGAVWANDGRLVCFFPPKKDDSVAFLENLGFKEMSRLSRADKVFEGLGRLQTGSPDRRITGTLGGSTEDGGGGAASDYSDGSFTDSSSSSSGSSAILPDITTRLPEPKTWRTSASLGVARLRSTDNWSASGAFTANRFSDVPHTIISIHNLTDLLPAKHQLACHYRICGKGADLCAHNATVAREAGCHDIAQVWGLVGRILDDRPLHRSPGSSFGRQSDLTRLRKKDSAIDLSCDLSKKNDPRRDAGGIITRWGNHPFGGRWLIPALFDYFERDGDVQMVAMLACVLHQANPRNMLSSTTGKAENKASSSDNHSAVMLVQNKLRTAEVSQAAAPFASPPKDIRSPPTGDLRRNDSFSSYSAIPESSFVSHSGGVIAERKIQGRKDSTSTPSENQLQSRSGSGLGSVIASSFSRSFTLVPSSLSPPKDSLKRHDASFGNDSSNGVSGYASPSTAKPAGTIHSPRAASPHTSRTHSDAGGEEVQKQSVVSPKFKVTIKNKERFDADRGRVSFNPLFGVPFLDPKKSLIYCLYCAAYAEILAMWTLPVLQSEIRKMGGLISCSADMHNYWYSPPGESLSLPIRGSEKQEPISVKPDDEALDIRHRCVDCGEILPFSIFSVAPRPADPEDDHCRKCLSPYRLQPFKPPCVICDEVVDGMLIPCLGCGHVFCVDCYRLWFLEETDHGDGEANIRSCPTGCGCICTERTFSEAHVSSEPPPLPTKKMTENKASSARIDEDDDGEVVQLLHTTGPADSDPADELKGWYAAPFASLAKGLGAGLSRGLRQENGRNT